ncbi:hypothetical protein EJV47_09655 [Hymenobacter gummosus]|uniref:DUF4249 family protein n=1 Tax=Hymenobacter gummosus TaxID=1776032 RepID=A0A3S0HAF6_9BACT|nr:hypothetical protein [Hymenobacter gummosus]RTQ50872.1 hypothetical protein EJV47_09655 [Hymenobacter gummosus]
MPLLNFTSFRRASGLFVLLLPVGLSACTSSVDSETAIINGTSRPLRVRLIGRLPNDAIIMARPRASHRLQGYVEVPAGEALPVGYRQGKRLLPSRPIPFDYDTVMVERPGARPLLLTPATINQAITDTIGPERCFNCQPTRHYHVVVR